MVLSLYIVLLYIIEKLSVSCNHLISNNLSYDIMFMDDKEALVVPNLWFIILEVLPMKAVKQT